MYRIFDLLLLGLAIILPNIQSTKASRLKECGDFGCYSEPAYHRGINEFANWLDQIMVGSADASADETVETLRSKTTFHLYFSRNNLKLREVAKIDDKIPFGSYTAKKPTKLIIHGWQNEYSSPVNQIIKNAYLKNFDVNVIIVDWSHASFGIYHRSKATTVNIAEVVSEFIERLVKEYGLEHSDLHIIGHSLGAHISGMAARNVKSGRIARVTALDPAAPLFDLNSKRDRLAEDAAEFVEVIHTCGKRLGIQQALGHVDFFPNGGSAIQRGCLTDFFGQCSHARAYDIFAEALEKPRAFLARKCADWKSFRDGLCKRNDGLYIGENVNISARGSFFLRTDTTAPLGLSLYSDVFTNDDAIEDETASNWADSLFDWIVK